ncbi:hypothetical protein B0O80DRAFT_421261 [Mortierella sp. GBAus27b]|nr:hypothetical protein B0O80DRAFT_421261 [Mortierella sp. GBAus27b]
MYIPAVPIAVPVTSPATTPNSAHSNSIPLAAESGPIRETKAQVVLDSPPSSASSCPPATIDASIQSRTGVCLATNNTDVDLRAIHLALIRTVSHATGLAPASTASHSRAQEYTYSSPESTTIHTATVPIARVNAHLSWSQQLQFRLPFNLSLLPTIDQSVTPLFKIDYYVLVSIPIPHRHTGFVKRLTAGSRKRSMPNLTTQPSASSPSQTDAHHSSPSRSPPSTAHGSHKNPSALQFTPIPIIIGTTSSNTYYRDLSWPMPNYLEVADRPAFVRDRFEEEMMQHFSSMEGLLTEEDDGDDMSSLGNTAETNSSLAESDDDDIYDGDTKDPARFGSSEPTSHPRTRRSYSWVETPPQSPSQGPTVVDDDIVACPPFHEHSSSEQTE